MTGDAHHLKGQDSPTRDNHTTDNHSAAGAHALGPSAPQESVGRPWYVSALLALSAVTLMLVGAWMFARTKSAYPFYGTVYNMSATAFKGTDQNGKPFAFTPGQGGGATAIFFGFTHCPNICPLSLAYLAKARQALPADQQKLFKIVLVSVDPDRDTSVRLKEYVDFFGEATGVRIPEPQLSQVAKAYGVGYQKADIKSKTDYQINHTTATYLIDGGGQLRLLWDYTQLPQVERVVADLQYVLKNPQRGNGAFAGNQGK